MRTFDFQYVTVCIELNH